MSGSHGPSASGGSDEAARAHFFKGNELFLQRRFAEAAAEFRSTLAHKPGHAKSLYNLALSLMELEQLQEARSLLEQAVDTDPDYQEAHGNLILLHNTMGDHPAALLRLEAARAKWPDDPTFKRIADGFQRESLNREVEKRRRQLTRDLIGEIGLDVIQGPFTGMRLNDETWWGDGDLAPRLLGCYEEELNGAIEKAIGRLPSVVINIGCAEGHYAIGLARRLPQARVFAHDISDDARRLCGETAKANGVADRLTIGGACSHAILRQHLSGADRTLAVLDCEGAELHLLDPAAVPEFHRCDLIIECHDFLDRSITPILVERFSATHDVDVVIEAGRDPNRYTMLHHLHSTDRWVLVAEGRPEFMHWLVLWSKARN